MGKVFLQINTTLDGYIEDPAGEIDWHFVDDEFEEFINETLRSIDAVVFGRGAYEPLSEYWPTAASSPGVSERHIEAARLMRELPKYIISDSLERTEWENSRLVRGDGVVGEITELKVRVDKDIAVFAGGGVASSFVRLGLIDEYRLIINPVLQGAGTPLFQGDYDKRDLRLSDVRRFDSGALVLTYQPDLTTSGPRPL